MADIYAVKERWKEDLMSRRGVIGVGVSEKGIVVFVEPDIDIDPPIPTSREGIPVETKIMQKFKLL